MKIILNILFILLVILSCVGPESKEDTITGPKIYFNRYPTSNTVEVWCVSIDGKQEKRVSTDGGIKSDYRVIPSPNGKFKILSSYFESDPDLYIRVTGSQEKINLTKGIGINSDPVFSHDGSMIVYKSKRNNNVDLYTMKLDGFRVKRLTTTDLIESNPKFSQDGQKIVYTTHGEKSENDPLGLFDDNDSDYEIYLMDVNGNNQRNLTKRDGSDNFPEFSPDEIHIVFQSRRDGNEEIYIMDIDGSNVKRLTHNGVDDIHPHFSPDGTKIVYQTQINKNREIMIMDTNGDNKKRLTKNRIDDWYPRFEI
ncbi:MAG: PD40 domain-containing protein [Candidatus Marinimicrobia bacterium]|nr:PD40 domain-containing protein [Candidatus Neomarinimicrobiota bacterium]